MTVGLQPNSQVSWEMPQCEQRATAGTMTQRRRVLACVSTVKMTPQTQTPSMARSVSVVGQCSCAVLCRNNGYLLKCMATRPPSTKSR